ncbi:unnamed protein product [Anisakis simplex]|uniref:Seipin n=1 Tax=Anisakis simplex TaxID=6269 RepID=A0A0M3JRK8_ANISI|nr:unnamed protein product [Anisakis simplex]
MYLLVAIKVPKANRDLSHLMLLNGICVVLNVLIFLTPCFAQPEYSDPTAQELALLDWTSGIRVAYCTDAGVEKLATPFKKNLPHIFCNLICGVTQQQLGGDDDVHNPFSELCETGARKWPSGTGTERFQGLVILSEYLVPMIVGACLCNRRVRLKEVLAIAMVHVFVEFTSEQIVLLDGYPRRDYGAVQFRFVVVLPHGAIPRVKVRQPLLSKQILSNFLRKYLDEISKRLDWRILSYERFPKYDAITEFMNTALIPIGLFLLIFMFFLAYWSSTFSSSSSSNEGWVVSGASGGKNAALRRTLELIEEQRDGEIDDQRSKAGGLDGPMTASMISTAKDTSSGKKSSEVLLDVSGLPTDENDSFGALPEIVVVPSDVRQRHSVASSRRYSRRLSSVDEVMKEKRHRRIRNIPFAGRGPKRAWKSGSMALGGFGKS